MTSPNSWWSKSAGKGKRRRRRAQGPGPKDRPARRPWRLSLEELEPRLAPTANLNYNWGADHASDPIHGASLTLKVAAHDGNPWLQVVDNDAASLVREVQLNDDCAVGVTGGPLSDVLTVDLGFTGAAPAFGITVTYDGGGPDLLGIDDKVVIAGSGTQYKPQSFQLTA